MVNTITMNPYAIHIPGDKPQLVHKGCWFGLPRLGSRLPTKWKRELERAATCKPLISSAANLRTLKLVMNSVEGYGLSASSFDDHELIPPLSQRSFAIEERRLSFKRMNDLEHRLLVPALRAISLPVQLVVNGASFLYTLLNKGSPDLKRIATWLQVDGVA